KSSAPPAAAEARNEFGTSSTPKRGRKQLGSSSTPGRNEFGNSSTPKQTFGAEKLNRPELLAKTLDQRTPNMASLQSRSIPPAASICRGIDGLGGQVAPIRILRVPVPRSKGAWLSA